MQEKSLAPTLGPPITRSLGFFNSFTNMPLGLIGLAAESKTNECRNAPSLQIAKRGFRESKGALDDLRRASVEFMFTVITVHSRGSGQSGVPG